MHAVEELHALKGQPAWLFQNGLKVTEIETPQSTTASVGPFGGTLTIRVSQ